MSYCRRGPKSDVYLYESDRGIECSACWLHETERWWATMTFDSADDAVAHVRLHIAEGHLVPDCLLEDLQARTELRFIEWCEVQRA